MPEQEAADVIVSTGLCGGACGSSCGCRTLQLCVPAGNRVCFFCAIRQEVCGGIKCGGEFLLIHTLCVTRGDECVRPFFVLDLYSSCQYVGTLKVPMADPEQYPDGVCQEHGFVRLEKKIELAGCIDNVILTLCFEVVLKGPPPPYYGEYGYGQPPQQGGSKCEVGPENFEFSVCAAQIRRISGLEGTGAPKSGCATNPIPIIKRVFPDGRVEFTPGSDQVATIIETLEGPPGCGPLPPLIE